MSQDRKSEIVNRNPNHLSQENLGKLTDGVDLKRKECFKEQAPIKSKHSVLSDDVSNADSTRRRGKCTCKCNLKARQTIDDAKHKRCTFLSKIRRHMQLLFSFVEVIVLHAKIFYNGVRDIVTEAWKLSEEETIEPSDDSEWNPHDPNERARVLSEERADESSDEDRIEMVFPAKEGGSSSETQQRATSESERTCNTIRISRVEPMETGKVKKMSSVVRNTVSGNNDLQEPGDISEEEVKSPPFEDDQIEPVILSAKPVSPRPKRVVFAQDNADAETPKINVHEAPSERRVNMALKSVQAVREQMVCTGAGVRNAARSLVRPLQRSNRGQSESQFFNQEMAGTTTTYLARLLIHTYKCDVEATRRWKHAWKIRCNKVLTNGTVLRVRLVIQPVDAHSCTVSIYPGRSSSGIRDRSPEYSAFVTSLQKTFFNGWKSAEK